MTLRVQDPEEARRAVPRGAGAGLEALDEQPLCDAARATLERALEGSRGELHWRTRKAVELHELLALAERCERLEVLGIDARTELRVELRLVVPTATLAAAPLDAASADPNPSRPLATGTDLASSVARLRALAGVPEPASPEHLRRLFAFRATDTQMEFARMGRLVVAPEARLVLHYPSEVLRGPLPGYGAISITAPARVWHPNVGFDRQQRLCLGHNIPRGMPARELVLSAYAALSMQAVSLAFGNPAGVMNSVALCYWREHERELPLTRDTLLAPLVPAAAPQTTAEAQR